MITITERQQIENAKIELRGSMALAAEREEYDSAADMKRILDKLEMSCVRSFTEEEISKLQSEVYDITGKGEVMGLFNKLLGVCVG